MGARIGDIEADYMLTFWNSCKLTAESPMYGVLASQGIASELSIVFGPEKGTDLSKTDLARAAEGYLKKQGLNIFDIWKLKARLRNRPAPAGPAISGKIVSIDSSGRVVSDISAAQFGRAGFKAGNMLVVLFGSGFVLEAPCPSKSPRQCMHRTLKKRLFRKRPSPPPLR